MAREAIVKARRPPKGSQPIARPEKCFTDFTFAKKQEQQKIVNLFSGFTGSLKDRR